MSNWKDYLPLDYKARGRILAALAHLERFMDKARLWPKTGASHCYVGISAGVDSMLLAELLDLLWRKKYPTKSLILLHLNHGTRLECQAEQEMLEHWAALRGREIRVKALNLAAGERANFEERARQKRYHYFSEQCREGELVYLGHHIDDSYEWSLMQKAKSSNLKASLGIPVVNGVFRRPFHCFTKKQIYLLAADLNLNFKEDSSNLDCRFERNYWRREIIPKIEKRNPHYLLHFVRQQNEQALMHGLSVFPAGEGAIFLEDALGQALALTLTGAGHFHGEKQKVYDWVRGLLSVSNNDKKRSQLAETVEQIIKAQGDGRQGPSSLAGEGEIYYYRGLLQFVDESTRGKIKAWDLSCDEVDFLERLIPFDPTKWRPEENIAPFWVIGKESVMAGLPPGLKKPHPLFPRLFAQVKREGLYIRPLAQLLLLAKQNKLNNRWHHGLYFYQPALQL